MANANNSERTTILKESIYDSLGAAIIELNKTKLIEGNTITLRYYTDDTKQRIDSLFAVVINSGIGNSCYKIISDRGLVVIHDFLKDSLPDVSDLITGEYYIYTHSDGVNYFVFLWGNIRKTVKIVDPCIVSCLGERNPKLGEGNKDNKGLYQVTTNSIRNLLDFYTKSEINNILAGLTRRIVILENDYIDLERRVTKLESYHLNDSTFSVKSFKVTPNTGTTGVPVKDVELSWEYTIVDYELVSQELYKGSDKVLELTPTSRSYTFLGEEFSETTTFRLVARAKMVKDGVESFKDVEKEATLTFKEAVVEIIPEVRTGIPGSILLSDREESLNEEDKLLELTEEMILNSTSISPKKDDEGRYVFSFELINSGYIHFIVPIGVSLKIVDGNNMNWNDYVSTGSDETQSDLMLNGTLVKIYQSTEYFNPGKFLFKLEVIE